MSDESAGEDDDRDPDLDGDGEEIDEEAKQKKRRERLEQNRISARESRKRKKNMIEELQRTVITLSREHKELSQRNDTLKQQLMELSQKVCKQSLRECFFAQVSVGIETAQPMALDSWLVVLPCHDRFSVTI